MYFFGIFCRGYRLWMPDFYAFWRLSSRQSGLSTYYFVDTRYILTCVPLPQHYKRYQVKSFTIIWNTHRQTYYMYHPKDVLVQIALTPLPFIQHLAYFPNMHIIFEESQNCISCFFNILSVKANKNVCKTQTNTFFSWCVPRNCLCLCFSSDNFNGTFYFVRTKS